MATTLKPKQIERLKKFKIKAVTAEKAEKELVAFLESQEVNDLEEDLGLDNLLDMAELFVDESEDTVDEEEEEVETKPTKKVVKKAAVVEEEEDEEDEPIDDEDEDNDEEELEDEEDEEPAPKKTATVIKKKSAPAKTKETEEELDELAEEVQKTKPQGGKAKTATPAKKVADNIFDARNNEDHLEYLEFLNEHFPTKKYQYDILKQGFTIRALGKNSKVTVMNFDELKLVDGELMGNLYLNRFKSVEDLQEFLPDEYAEAEIGMFRGESHPCIKKMTSTDVLTIMESDVYTESVKRSSSTDTKMGVNRKALEESIENKAATPKKTVTVTTVKKK